jgi:SurA N-terminal domain
VSFNTCFKTRNRGDFANVSGQNLVIAALSIAMLPLAGCGGGERLATVGDRQITRAQVDRLVEHGREEATREGASYPEKGSDAYRALEREGLSILVARAQLEQAARELGVTVSKDELDAQVAVPQKPGVEVVFEEARRGLGIAEEHEKGESAKLLQDAIRVQLILQRVQERLGVDELKPWLARTRQLPVDYADGWSP